jgi:hypothetical protein
MPTLLRTPQTYLSEPLDILTQVEAHTYIGDWGQEELLQLRRTWQLNASRRDLIDFGSRHTKIRYSYNPYTMQYYRQVRGQRRQQVPISSIKLDINRFAINICKEQKEWSKLLLSDRISVQEWYDGTTRMMKYSYRAAFDVARGVSGEMSVAQQQEFSQVVEREISKFNLYARQVASGKVPLDGHLLNAVCSLGRRINRLFENWRLWLARQNGFTQARRRLTVAEHCRDSKNRKGCIELARMGWRPIWDITPIGGATCWDGCLCTMEYR